MAVTERGRARDVLERAHISVSPETRVKIYRAGLVAAVLLVSALLGLSMGSTTSMYLSLGAVALVVVVVIMLFLSDHLQWGLILLIATAAFTPFSLPTGTNSRIADSMVVAAVFVVLWILRMLIVERRFHLVKSPMNLPLLGFILVSIISLVWSMFFRDAEVVVWSSFPMVQVGMTAVMLLLPAAFLMVGNLGNRPVLVKIITWVMIAAGPLGLAANFLGVNLPVNNGGLFAMWVMSLSLGLAFFQPGLGWFLRLLLLAQVAGWVVWSFVMHISWLAGWLPGMMAIGILLVIRSRKLFLFGILAALVIFVAYNSYFMERIAMERAESGDSRVAAWRVNWRVTGEHLLFGTGPGGYAAYYMYYFPNEGMATHNNYVDVIAQTGVVGLALWLWFFGITAWEAFRLVLRLHGRKDFYEGLANAVFAGTIACIMIMMFGDWLLPFAYTQTIAGYDYAVYSWIFMGMVVAINQIIPETPPVVPA